MKIRLSTQMFAKESCSAKALISIVFLGYERQPNNWIYCSLAFIFGSQQSTVIPKMLIVKTKKFLTVSNGFQRTMERLKVETCQKLGLI